MDPWVSRTQWPGRHCYLVYEFINTKAKLFVAPGLAAWKPTIHLDQPKDPACMANFVHQLVQLLPAAGTTTPCKGKLGLQQPERRFPRKGIYPIGETKPKRVSHPNQHFSRVQPTLEMLTLLRPSHPPMYSNLCLMTFTRIPDPCHLLTV